MIEQLELQNFQSHKETTLEFEEGVNVIIGPSDSGKTSIIRALRWLAWNRPLGDAFRSNWGGETFVRAHFDDGCMAERLEADNARHYRTDANGYALEFEAFGTDVPEEVQKLLNFSEINIQEQMDSPFLISNNPGQVSRHFNKIANIDQIDTSLRNVESWVRQINQDIKSTEEEVKRHEKKLEEFDYLDKMEADIEVLEQLEEHKNNQASKASKLDKLINNIMTLTATINEKSALLPAEDLVNELLDMIQSRKADIKQYKQLKSLCKNIKNVDSELKEIQKLTDSENIINSILDLYNSKEQMEEEANDLRSKIFAIESAADAIKDEKQELEILEQEWHEQAPETCPLCDSELD